MDRRHFLANAFLTTGAVSAAAASLRAGEAVAAGILAEVPDRVSDFEHLDDLGRPALKPGFADPIVYRPDLREWSAGSASQLLDALTQLRDLVGIEEFEQFETWASPKIGSLAICRWGEHEWTTPEHPSSTRWYVGFYDIADGTLHLYDGSQEGEDLARFGEHIPFALESYGSTNVVVSHVGTIAELLESGMVRATRDPLTSD